MCFAFRVDVRLQLSDGLGDRGAAGSAEDLLDGQIIICGLIELFGIAVNYRTQCHQQHIEKCAVTWYR